MKPKLLSKFSDKQDTVYAVLGYKLSYAAFRIINCPHLLITAAYPWLFTLTSYELNTVLLLPYNPLRVKT